MGKGATHMTGMLLKTAYQLGHHRIGEWSLARWGVALPLAALVWVLLQWFLRGMLPVSPVRWLALLLIFLFAAGLASLQSWASRQMYVLFDPQNDLAPPVPQPLDPADKVRVHSTGRFEVEGKLCVFADLLAYWRTFANREHAVMAIVHKSRFLLLGTTAARDLGMWYIFFKPETLETITPGIVTFGRTRRLALRVTYHYSLEARKRKPAKSMTRIAYLGFEHEEARRAVWADMISAHE